MQRRRVFPHPEVCFPPPLSACKASKHAVVLVVCACALTEAVTVTAVDFQMQGLSSRIECINFKFLVTTHSPTHYRDDSLFVFPIRENTATAILPRARGPSLCIFFSLRTCCSTFHIWQCTEALLYEKWYFHGRHKNCICIADADDLDFPRFSGYSDILWF